MCTAPCAENVESLEANLLYESSYEPDWNCALVENTLDIFHELQVFVI